MGRSCPVCSRPDRDELERRVVAGDPIRRIARQVGVGRDALSRHAASHLPSSLAALREAGRDIESARALDRLEALFAEGQQVLGAARAEGRHPVSLAAIRELRGVVELIARISGELDDRPSTTVNIVASAEWIEVRTLLHEALRPYPEASAAVVAALAKVAS